MRSLGGRSWAATVCHVAALGAALAGIAAATDLRIETSVYQPGDETPRAQSVTLFRGDTVYDFRDAESRVTVFRPGMGGKPGRFVLLDTERRIRTEVTTDRVAALMTKLSQWAAAQEDPFLKFTSDPVFVETYNPDSGDLRLEHKLLRYRLVTTPVPADREGAKLRVRVFLDEFARLQTLLDSGLPPAPRLRLNEALFRHGVLPLEVELYARGDDDWSVRAEHVPGWILSKGDLARIDRVADQMATFAEVTNADFHRGRQVAQR